MSDASLGWLAKYGRSDLAEPSSPDYGFTVQSPAGITDPERLESGAPRPASLSPGSRLRELLAEMDQLLDQEQARGEQLARSGYDYAGREQWVEFMSRVGRY